LDSFAISRAPAALDAEAEAEIAAGRAETEIGDEPAAIGTTAARSIEDPDLAC